METTHGTWGDRRRVFQWDGGLVTILELVPNQRCSWHSHNTAYNMFYVIDGELGVKTDKGYITKLQPGHSFTVEPGIFHEFQTYGKETTLLEIAYVKYNEYDINREKLGGKLDE